MDSLTATAKNGKEHSEIISELEFSVSGIGRSARNPFELIEACKCSASSDKIELSFNGGAFNGNGTSWFEFDKMDFGRDGADTFSVPMSWTLSCGKEILMLMEQKSWTAIILPRQSTTHTRARHTLFQEDCSVCTRFRLFSGRAFRFRELSLKNQQRHFQN